ncbi:MAG: hypothetical protein ABI026_02905 [Gemmatimonadaceae bacterium]
MLAQSYSRLLGAGSVLTGLVTLALLAAASPANGITMDRSSGHRPRTVDARSQLYMSKIAPADTDSTIVKAPPETHFPKRRGGYVVTADQLALEQDYPLSSVIVAHFPGIRVIRGADMDRVASGLHMDLTGTPCFLQIFMDGVRIVNGGVDWVSVRNLETIEYRTAGNIPVQYQNREAGAMCGALMLWSKRF